MSTTTAFDSISTFGFHASSSLPFNQQKEKEIAERTNRIALLALSWVIGVSAIVVSSFLCPVAIPIVLAGILVTESALVLLSQKINRYKTICQTSGIIFNHENVLRYQPVEGRCDILPTEHSSETEAWREKLIASANYNIVVSGNYCGGAAFSRMLNAIEKRWKEKPDLEVVIISSPKFLKKADRERIALLQQAGRHIDLVESPDIWHISPGIKKVTNHTKVFTVDFGKRFIQGGSGIKDNFVCPGTDDESREAYRAKAGLPVEDLQKPRRESGFLSHIIPGSFRDGDFVGESPVESTSVGYQTHIQALLLAYRWQEYNKKLAGISTSRSLTVNDFGALTGTTTPFTSSDSLVVRMLRRVLPQDLNFSPLPLFSEDPRKASNVSFKILAQGPQNSRSPFAAHLLAQIKKAEKQIVINHMYFHPSSEIFNALVEAANRGVKITIITNGSYQHSPTSHAFFASRNRFNYQALRKQTHTQFRQNIEVYEYEQKKKGLHKKLVIVDDTVIAGSSNLGHKSLSLSCDDELNFVARSPKLAEKTWEVCLKDIQRSRKISNFSLSLRERLNAALQRVLAPLID